MKKYLLILFLFSFLRGISQPPSKFFNKFGGFGVDIGYGIKETFDRQYIIAGSTSSSGNGGVDAQLLLIDSMGQLKWAKTYGGVLSDVAKSVVVNPVDSGFIFAGHTSSFGNGGYDVYVVRTDKNGNVIWQKSFGGIDWDFGKDIVFAPDGNLVICGNSYSTSYGKSDAYLIKVNTSNGNLMWTKHYGGNEDDDFRSLKITGDNNNIILTGQTNSYNDALGDIYFFKTDMNGDSVSHRSYGLKNKIDYGNEILDESVLGGYIIGGGTESYSSGKKDAFIFKISLTNDSLWLRSYGNATNDQECSSVLLTKNYQGRYGFSYSEVDFAFYKRDPKNLNLDNTGFFVVGNTFGETEDEELFDITNTSDKGFIGVGYTKSYGGILEDIYVVKYDSVFQYGGKLIGIKENTTITEGLSIYPTILTNEDPDLTIISIESFSYGLYDLYSREVIKGEELEYKTNLPRKINLLNLPKGIYILRIQKGSQVFNQKIIKN